MIIGERKLHSVENNSNTLYFCVCTAAEAGWPQLDSTQPSAAVRVSIVRLSRLRGQKGCRGQIANPNDRPSNKKSVLIQPQ